MNTIKTGEFIREQREKNGLSQEELALRLSVDPAAVSEWENGTGRPDTSLFPSLAEILGVSVEELIDPRTLPAQSAPAYASPAPASPAPAAASVFVPATETDALASNPVIVLPEEIEKTTVQRKATFSDYFSSKKLKKCAASVFGKEHEWQIKRKFLRSGVFHRHSRNEFDRALTQGMFRDDPAHKNGVAAPFLFFYCFLVCFFCFALSIRIDPSVGFLFSSSVVVIPYLVFAYELEFPRTVGIFRAIFILLIGGMCSILASLVLYLFGLVLPDVASTILAGPIEESAKAALVIAAVMILKPRHISTGILIGFCIGAGFTLFENVMYCSNSYVESVVLALTEETEEIGEAVQDAGSSAVWTGVIRSLTDLFIGHHFWAGIYGGALVLSKKDEQLYGKHLFDRNVVFVFLICVVLHTAFDTILLFGTWWSVLLAVVLCGFFTRMLFNRILTVGLCQYEISEEYLRLRLSPEPEPIGEDPDAPGTPEESPDEPETIPDEPEAVPEPV